MKSATVSLFLLLGCSLQGVAQYVIPGAQQQPAWVFPIYFEDADGNRDTVYHGYDEGSVTVSVLSPNPDSIFGEMFIPYDSVGFTVYLNVNPWWFDADSVLKVMVSPALGQLTIFIERARLPMTMRWDPQLFYSDSLPFPDQDPLPRMEVVLWPSDLFYADFEGEYCGFTEPIILSDVSWTYPVCTFADSITLDSWACPGCLFSGDFQLWLREWSGGWVGIDGPDDRVVGIFPNPFSDVLHLRPIDVSDRATVSIYSIQGQLLFSGTLDPNDDAVSMDTRLWARGVYLVSIRTDRGLTSTKVIKTD